MADSTETDTDVQYLAPALIALIAGLVIHSFIIAVNVNDWSKGRSVTFVDHIVTSLGISRMCAQCAGTLYLLVDTLFLKNLYSHITLAIMNVVCSFFIYANIWLTTLFSVVFCLKISNLHTRLFLYLRGVIVQRTVYIIVASALLSALNTLMTFWVATTKAIRDRTNNTTRDNLFMDCFYTDSIYSFTIGNFIPLLSYYVSSVLLFASLYHHTTRMKRSNNLTINLETYYSVMKFVSFTFIYSTMYFIGYFVCVFYRYFYCIYLALLYIVLEFLPALHSSYLIYRISKLRDQMSKICHIIIAFLFQRKDAETRENIEVADQ